MEDVFYRYFDHVKEYLTPGYEGTLNIYKENIKGWVSSYFKNSKSKTKNPNIHENIHNVVKC